MKSPKLRACATGIIIGSFALGSACHRLRPARSIGRSIGSAFSFASSDEIVGKFRKLTRFTVAASQQDEVIGLVLGMEEIDDIARLPRAFQAR